MSNPEYLDKTGLDELVSQTKSYIGNKVSKKIDKPVNVQPGKVLQTDSHGNPVWGDSVPQADIVDAVENWLEENIDPGSAVTLDPTLTEQNAAAQAKAVGDAIDSLKENLVVVDDDEPESDDNVIWVPETPENEVVVPTISELNEVAGTVAKDYADLTFPIKAGTLCRHNYGLYAAKQDIPTQEAWTSGHWSTKTNIADKLDSLSSAINQITEEQTDYRQLYDNANPNIFNGYSNGENFYSSANHRIVYIPCEPNTEYTISADNALWTANGVYQSETVPVANGSAMPFSAESTAVAVVENGRRYITNTTKSNAHYLAVFYYNANRSLDTEANIRAAIMIAKGASRTAFVPYGKLLYIKADRLPSNIALDVVYDRCITEEEATMETGDVIEFDSPNIKKNNLLTFSANINSFGSLKIGQGRNALNQTAYIVIDSSTVKVYRYTTEPVEWVSLNHGLTIQDYIEVSIEVSNTEIGWAKLNIYSNGASYSYARMAWLGCGNVAYAEVVSGSYANCLLKHYCADYDKEFWLFGDSYFDHWVTYALADGYDNFLCDGWSGRKAEQALPSLEILLEHGKPKNIVWCLGMNNGDSSSAVNANWLTAYNSLVELCENNNINLILCTIPNTPTVNNNYKNTIIRNSGLQYIDLAKAVGSDISTSWYSGLLSTDNVHPSTTGDKMIAKFIETALPQIYGY